MKKYIIPEKLNREIKVMKLNAAAELMREGLEDEAISLIADLYRQQLEAEFESLLAGRDAETKIIESARQLFRSYMPRYFPFADYEGKEDMIEITKSVLEAIPEAVPPTKLLGTIKSIIEANPDVAKEIGRAFYASHIAGMKTEKKAQASRENIKKANDPALREKRSAAQKARFERERREREQSSTNTDKKAQVSSENIKKANDLIL